MTRETRIAMLVGLLFIIMFGLVISGLTTHSDSASPPKVRGDQPVNQRYAGVIEPPPPGETPGSPAGRPAARNAGSEAPGTGGGDSARSTLRIAERPAEANSLIEVVVRRDPERPAEVGRPAVARVAGEEVATIVPPPEPAPPPAAPARKHVVKAGDTLLKIARTEYGPQNEALVALIRQANKNTLRGGDRSLQVGMELVIPPPPPSAAPARPATAVAPAPSRPDATPSYAVLDSAGLRRMFTPGSETPPLAARPPAPVPLTPPASPASPVTLLPPAAPVPPAAALVPPMVVSDRPADAPKKYYVVRPGDSLAKIAREKMGDGSRAAVRKLYTANKSSLPDPDDLPVGMKLELPA